MSEHETPLTRRYWRDHVGGVLVEEFRAYPDGPPNGARHSLLQPIAEKLGIEVIVDHAGGIRRGREPSLTPNIDWVKQWSSGVGRVRQSLPVAKKSQTSLARSIKAVVETGEHGDDGESPVEGRDLVVVTTTSGKPGMYTYGEALVNRMLLERGGARSVRSVVLCGQPDTVLGPLSAESGIETFVIRP